MGFNSLCIISVALIIGEKAVFKRGKTSILFRESPLLKKVFTSAQSYSSLT